MKENFAKVNSTERALNNQSKEIVTQVIFNMGKRKDEETIHG
jgi:hypothetical protein